jgi:hypothetical protein
MNTEYLEIEKKIKNEMIDQVVNSNGELKLMSLDKILDFVSVLNSIKNNSNVSTSELDNILYEDDKSMQELEKRMKLARDSMH